MRRVSKTSLDIGRRLPWGHDTKFVGGDHVLSSGIKVAWHITAVVALEGLQAHPAKGRFRNVRACEKSGKLCNFAVDRVDIEANGFERGRY